MTARCDHFETVSGICGNNYVAALSRLLFVVVLSHNGAALYANFYGGRDNDFPIVTVGLELLETALKTTAEMFTDSKKIDFLNL